ncbi:MAG: hypothetical protein DIZ80_08715 [endosymbiont of Galathealinum brachiosum]|uniref:Uncharacterized protein n=1 Tax=endosymbiont of Galathealinum brachiosum TaxID=2200906 RepID=A0A370DDI8_9GAMM|nr:MAG: hypothetical protein DIZ80_08715 [endosymbiont of Galathealinum brachiosum]
MHYSVLNRNGIPGHFTHKILISAIALSSASLHASPATLEMDELLNMDIRQLMDIPVTLASGSKIQHFSTPAASYVITHEDIQRSGLRSIPELLRLVPGFHVGKVDSSKWAINSRDAPNQFAGSMLVMMDERILYNPLFGGTYWEVQDYVLEDIERIEVIRGAGGSLWGANASNGVINIITRSSQDTQGHFIQAAAGGGDNQAEAVYRYGFTNKAHSGRIYIKQRRNNHGEYLDDTESNNNGFFTVGDQSHDDGKLSQGGFRVDFDLSDMETLAFQGDYSEGKLKDIRFSNTSNNVAENDIFTRNANLLLRWNKKLSHTNSININTYYDWSDRMDDGFIDNREIFNIDLQHNTSFRNHFISWGIEYRHIEDDTGTPVNNSAIQARLSLDPTSREDDLAQFFLQDQINFLDDKLQLIIGTRIENNEYTGNESQPNIRLSFLPDKQNTYWVAISDSVRTPTRGDSDFYLNFNDLQTVCGFLGPDFVDDPVLGCILPINQQVLQANTSLSYELGLRKQFSDDSLIDIATFYNALESTSADGIFVSDGRAFGIEIDYRYNFNRNTRLAFWYAKHKMFRYDENGIEQPNRGLPEDSAHLRLYWDINNQWQLDSLAYYNSEVTNSSDTTTVAALTRLDIHLGWEMNKTVKLNLYLTNITEDVHGEDRESTRINTGIPRGFLFSVESSF